MRGHLDESFLLTCLHMYVWTPVTAVRRGSSPLGLNAPRTPRGRSCYGSRPTSMLRMQNRSSSYGSSRFCCDGLYSASRWSAFATTRCTRGYACSAAFSIQPSRELSFIRQSLGAYGFCRGLPSSPSSCRTFSNLVAGLSAASNPSLCGLGDIPNTEWHRPASD